MRNKNFVICNRMYVVDVDVCDYATSILVTQAQRSQDEEYQTRIIQSVVLRAIGLEAFILIPASDVGTVVPEIVKILIGGGNGESHA